MAAPLPSRFKSRPSGPRVDGRFVKVGWHRIASSGQLDVGVACEGCPPLAELVKRYEATGGRYYVCPICFNTKKLSQESLIGGAELQGTVPLWAWIGDEAATAFSY